MGSWGYTDLGRDNNNDWMGWSEDRNIDGDGTYQRSSDLTTLNPELTEVATSSEAITATATGNNGFNMEDPGMAQTWTDSSYAIPFPFLTDPSTEVFPSSSSNIVAGFEGSMQGVLFGAAMAVDIPKAAYVPPVSSPPWMSSRVAKENESKEQEKFLVKLRQAGLGFDDISAQMKTKFGLEVSANALVKRYQKAADAYLSVSPIIFKFSVSS